MKKTITQVTTFSLLIIALLPLELLGQNPWVIDAKKNENKPHFEEVQRSFKEYWRGIGPDGKGKIPKGRGYKQYKRWEWFWEPRVGKDGSFPSTSILMEEWNKYKRSKSKKTSNFSAIPPRVLRVSGLV